MLSKREFLGLALKLALPIMVQNLISTLVNTADTVMLGFVSQTGMSATSLANQYTFLLFCFYYGLVTGTSVMCAQYWGKGDKKTIERVLGLAIRITVIISVVFAVVGIAIPEQIMRLFTDSPETIVLGGQYLRLISISFVFMGISMVYMGALRSTGKVIMPSVTYVISLVVNIGCNALFIFGLFGAPKLGVIGVAVGTVIARIVEVIICIVYSIAKSDIKIRIKYIFSKAGILIKDLLKITLPAVANDVIWSLATAVFTSILGHLGDDIVAANTVAIMVVNIGAIATRGFACATTIVVSNALGENKIDEAKEYGKRMVIITFIVSLIGCAVILAIRPLMLQFYADKLTPLALSYLGSLMIMTTWRLVGEGLNTCFICGCFRGGGDSKTGMILDAVFMWAVAVPLMAIAAYVIKLPPIWVYFVMSLDEFYKLPVVFAQYKKYKWLKNITREADALETQ